jgi:hypothetical protein
MANPDQRLERLTYLLVRYQSGVYTALEVAGFCIDVADSEIAAALLGILPAEVLTMVRDRVNEYPTTSKGWATLKLMDLGGLELDPVPSASGQDRLARRQASIGALREEFLAQDRERPDDVLLEPARSYPLLPPGRAFTAAAALLQALEEDKAQP